MKEMIIMNIVCCIVILFCWFDFGYGREDELIKLWNINDNLVVSLSLNSSSNVYRINLQFISDDRLDCKDDKSTLMSITNSTGFYNHAVVYGPDEILVFIEGKTLQSFILNYKGCHKYEKSFIVHLSGKYFSYFELIA